jgi:hypothetical protein
MPKWLALPGSVHQGLGLAISHPIRICGARAQRNVTRAAASPSGTDRPGERNPAPATTVEPDQAQYANPCVIP